MQKTSLLGVFTAFIVSMMLMVDVPFKANDPMLKEPVKGLGAAPAMNHGKEGAVDIQAYDQGHAHMMLFADAVSDGSLKQHPKKFGK